MKFPFCILLFSFSSFGQDSGLTIDTAYYSNDSIYSITQVYVNSEDRKIKEGFRLTFDSTGILLSEGRCHHASKVPCVDCYREVYKYGTGNIWEKYDYTDRRGGSIKIGEWKEYFINGQLKSVGAYNGKVRERTIIDCPERKESYSYSSEGVVCNGLLSIDYLKEGLWIYYDINGVKIKTEFFIDSHLVRTEMWE
jgi:antitoxin component YwqK of YwqJK toxin-antitoxin module